eukprot:SAG11_NODE_37370_length_257_cov_0.658228_1_plen_85_part_11
MHGLCRCFYAAIFGESETAPLRAMVPAGTAIVFDSRTLHRGLGNRSLGHRHALVFRFDARATPPPGMAMAGTLAFEHVGFVAAAC